MTYRIYNKNLAISGAQSLRCSLVMTQLVRWERRGPLRAAEGGATAGAATLPHEEAAEQTQREAADGQADAARRELALHQPGLGKAPTRTIKLKASTIGTVLVLGMCMCVVI